MEPKDSVKKLYCKENLKDNCKNKASRQNQEPQKKTAARSIFLLWAGKLLGPFARYPFEKYCALNGIGAIQTVSNKSIIFNLYGHLINLFVSRRKLRLGLCTHENQVWVNRKQQTYTETIEEVTRCPGTTVITICFFHVFRGSQASILPVYEAVEPSVCLLARGGSIYSLSVNKPFPLD